MRIKENSLKDHVFTCLIQEYWLGRNYKCCDLHENMCKQSLLGL